MKKIYRIFLVICFFSISFIYFNDYNSIPEKLIKIRSSVSPKSPVTQKKSRSEYFNNMLFDPTIGEIPKNIRQIEIKFAELLSGNPNSISKNNDDFNYTWKFAGPNDIGGRTRALAIDIDNPNTVIAGGVSGGIWKTTDNGNTWNIKSRSDQNLSVTSLVQDPREGFRNNWYYSAGEYIGNSASDRGFRAFYTGDGIFKSIDNGETWFLLESTKSNNPTLFESPFDYVKSIVISPVSGTIFTANNRYGIYRSVNGGVSFELSLGGKDQHEYSDIKVAENGVVVAIISPSFSSTNPDRAPGIYKSLNDGIDWINITPSNFPNIHERSVMAISKSNPDVCYVFTYTGGVKSDGNEDVRFYKIFLSSGNYEDRTSGLPAFSGNGVINTQGGYNMVLAVKPDDENFVLLGATNLFRSQNGFLTKPSQLNWIGGYNYRKFFMPRNHPDHHVLVFHPTNSKILWDGHDGGLSYTTDIADTTYPPMPNDYFYWFDKNKGYNVTQFYAIEIADAENDTRIVGGTQDNGSPYFRFTGTTISGSFDVSTGDGGHAFLGKSFAYVSSQQGTILRVNYDINKNPNDAFNPTNTTLWSVVSPTNAKNQLFITPFKINPSNENVMFYPAGSKLWRNKNLLAIPNFEQEGSMLGWDELLTLNLSTLHSITALEVTRNNPSNTLYIGMSSRNEVPKLYKFENANESISSAVEISINTMPVGAYLHSIAVNPNNGNELIVAFSNYNVESIHYSNDGGVNFTPVTGNLKSNESLYGPSIRSAVIMPTELGNIYFVGTSTGLYSTRSLNGSNTTWQQEASEIIGTTVIENIAYRTSDKRIVLGTHGRGAIVGDYSLSVGINEFVDHVKEYKLFQNYPNPFNPATTINFSLPESTYLELTIYDIAGRKVTTLLSEFRNEGDHSVEWNAGNYPSGIYFYKLKTNNFSMVNKAILLK